ncbi:hypothetical protein TNCV_4185941 [Trichonephila clavipes]|nr:hypothetical protein TNCV_4185941 [Trichonephila clavipes]
MSSVFGDCSQQDIQVPPAHTQELQVLDTVPSLFDEKIWVGGGIESHITRKTILIPSFLNPTLSLGCLLTSNPGCVYFGFYRLHSSRRRVREMFDVVGRLVNASRRQRLLAHGGSPILEACFGKARAALALKGFGQWDAI